MAGRTERAIREIHGADVEVIEIDENGEPAGRRFIIQRPDPFAGWPPLLKWSFVVLAIIVLTAVLIFALGSAAFGLWILWSLWF